MKLMYNFSINQIGDNYVAVPLGNNVVNFNGILKLNNEAAYIIEQLNTEIAYEALIKSVKEQFSCLDSEAKENVDLILSDLRNAMLLVE